MAETYRRRPPQRNRASKGPVFIAGLIILIGVAVAVVIIFSKSGADAGHTAPQAKGGHPERAPIALNHNLDRSFRRRVRGPIDPHTTTVGY